MSLFPRSSRSYARFQTDFWMKKSVEFRVEVWMVLKPEFGGFLEIFVATEIREWFSPLAFMQIPTFKSLFYFFNTILIRFLFVLINLSTDRNIVALQEPFWRLFYFIFSIFSFSLSSENWREINFCEPVQYQKRCDFYINMRSMESSISLNKI